MERLNYHHLLYFWMVAHEGTVARAAAQLRLAQPTLSAQVHALEGALNEKLFERAGRGLRLTEMGRLVFRYADEIFDKLYKVQPSAKKAVENAAGYATFSNFGMKIVFAGGGSGSGMAVDNKTKKTTYMKMVEVQAGLGMGAKKFRVVFVFDTQKALNDFVNSGWEFGGQTTAAAKSGDQGISLTGAVSVAPGVWMYQLTDRGLVAEITGKGTNYYKDSDLN